MKYVIAPVYTYKQLSKEKGTFRVIFTSSLACFARDDDGDDGQVDAITGKWITVY